MASKHILSLDVLESAYCSILNVVDTSVYSDQLPVDCQELLITPPGFNAPVLTTVQEGFNLPFNACSLGIQTTGCNDSINQLPDGIYIIKYSVAL